MTRASRVCQVPGCPSFRPCAQHPRARTAARGYGNRYRREADRVKAGATHCTTCGRAFTDTDPPTAGHQTALRDGGDLTGGLEPQCRACNFGWARTGL